MVAAELHSAVFVVAEGLVVAALAVIAVELHSAVGAVA